jgi:hypothetical protein
MLGRDDEASVKQWEQWFVEGVDAFVGYLNETYGPESMKDYRDLQKVRRYAGKHYLEESVSRSEKWLPKAVTDAKAAIESAEEWAVAQARRQLEALQKELGKYTKAWAVADDDEQQAILKTEADRVKAEIDQWRPRTVPLTDRLETLYQAERDRQAERDQLLAEWPTLESREKGEALRRLLTTVTLYWDRTYHPSLAKPTRPRKTSRAGRYSYALDRDRITWQYAASNLGGPV